MICAKNYETVSKFVKVMPRILWPLFFQMKCILNITLMSHLAAVKVSSATITMTRCITHDALYNFYELSTYLLTKGAEHKKLSYRRETARQLRTSV